MRRFRALSKLVLAVGLGPCVLVFLALLSSQIEQHVFRRRVQVLLAELQSLELRRTPWEKAQTELQRWGGNRKYDESCDSHKCTVRITLSESLFGFLSGRNLFVKLDDYFRWRLKLSYDQGPFVRAEFWLLRLYLRAGGRPAKVIANIGMRDGIVWSKGISVWIETLAHPTGRSGDEFVEFGLIAGVNTVPRFDYYGGPEIAPQLMLHPNYDIGRPGGCEICVMGWVKFTPYATSEDIHRLMQLNLSCLTQWHPCVTQADIMPAAWKEYLAERAWGNQSGGEFECSPVITEILGRDSANIVAAEVVRYHENFYSNGYDKSTATVRVLERLKGMAAWSVGETRDVTLLSGTICADDKVGVGSRLIFYGGWDRSNEVMFNPMNPWPVIPMNDANLNALRRGIDQDYSAMDKHE